MISAWLFLTAASPPAAVDIPAGTFDRGSTRAPDEGPVHPITLDAFAIDKVEVTIGDFEQFVRRAWADDKQWTAAGLAWRDAHPGGSGRDLRAADRRDTHPVVGVSWFEASAYCSWTGGKLPTEAQWERAACGGKNQAYPWGTGQVDGVKWSTKNSPFAVMRVDTAPATETSAKSPEGPLHMSGNVWEWTADWYHSEAYATAKTHNPSGPKTGRWKSIRGGSFMNLPSYCTCTHREPADPATPRLTLGFRCAYSSD